MASTRLTKVFGTSGNRNKWTWSAWIKRATLGSTNRLFGVYQNASYSTTCYLSGSNSQLVFIDNYNGAEQGKAVTSGYHRDVNGWYHIVVTYDKNNATSADKLILYVNGERVSLSIYIAPTQATTWNVDGLTMEIGAYNSADYFNGSMSHINFCDGYAYSASDFGQADANGVWTIKTSPSVSYGTTGFFILKDGNSVTDQSGNSNNWTVAGGTLTNTEDSPSNVFATWNPLLPDGQTLSNGNNTFTNGSDANWRVAGTTLGASSGKYYCEIKITELGGGSQIGVMNLNELPSNLATDIGSAAWSWSYYSTGNKRHSNISTSYGDTYTTGDIMGIAMDLDNNKLYFSKNGTWQNSGDPTSGATGTGSAFDLDAGGVYAFAVSSNDTGTNPIQDANFGNGYFGTTAVASAGTNASGIGIFEYDVPTGYTALSTKGLNL
jgi:hypothetical protein